MFYAYFFFHHFGGRSARLRLGGGARGGRVGSGSGRESELEAAWGLNNQVILLRRFLLRRARANRWSFPTGLHTGYPLLCP